MFTRPAAFKFLMTLMLLISGRSHAGLGSYTAAQINQIIQKKSITRIEDLLFQISGPDDLVAFNTMTQDPELFADLFHPRVIGTTHPALGIPRSIIAFTGKKGERGFGKLQLLEFDYASGSFVPHEFLFPAEIGATGPVKWLENPRRCLKCHSDSVVHKKTETTYFKSQIVPVWESYSGLPGFLGDEVANVNHDPLVERTHRVVQYMKETERYRVLKIPGHTYEENATKPEPVQKELDSRTLSVYMSIDLSTMGELINKWNAKRLFRFFRTQPSYSQIVPLIIGAMLEISDEDFLTLVNSTLQTKWTREELSLRSQELYNLNAAYERNKVKRRMAGLAPFTSFLKSQGKPEDYKIHFEQLEVALGSLADSNKIARLHSILQWLGFPNKKLGTQFDDGDLTNSPHYGLFNSLADLIFKEEIRKNASLSEVVGKSGYGIDYGLYPERINHRRNQTYVIEHQKLAWQRLQKFIDLYASQSKCSELLMDTVPKNILRPSESPSN